MPTYDYQCLKCEHVFEAFHLIANSFPPCPMCAGEVKRLLTAPALHGEIARAREKFVSSNDARNASIAKSGCSCCAGGVHRPK